ncbi:MAG TPA: DNA primase [Candidatus Dojkabacteria bacterium]|nr:DNA primase [Candidatus Dojkabacteria bacterium]
MNPNISDQIKEKIDIVPFIEKYVQLKQAGRNYTGLCPFHHEKTPSFSVSPELQIFKCFGCGKGGDIITFVMEMEKLEYKEALEKLAGIAGIKIEKERRYVSYIELLNSEAIKIYTQELYKPVNKIALDYLHKRELTDDLIKTFKIGYAPKNNVFLNYIRSKYKYNNDQLVNSGLFVIKNGQIRDKFIDRIVFPIFSSTNQPIAFSARVLPGNDYGPKYLNSPETAIFQKKNNLYGTNLAKNHIRREDLCILCEGQTDVISAVKAGFMNTVAPLGTGLTVEQLKLISQYTKNVLFLFDSDSAGQKALERAFILASQLGLTTYATNTEPFKDIDEMVVADKELLNKRISERSDTFSYLIAHKVKGLNLSDLKDYNLLKKYINELLSSIKQTDLRAFYISKVKEITGKDIISGSNYRESPYNNTNNRRTNTRKSSNLEYFYLTTILNNKNTIPSHHDLSILTDPEIIKIAEIIQANKGLSIKLLHEKLKEVDLEDLLEKVSLSEDYNDGSDIEKIYQRLYKNHLERQLKEIRVKLGAAEAIDNEKDIEKYSNMIAEIASKIKATK